MSTPRPAGGIPFSHCLDSIVVRGDHDPSHPRPISFVRVRARAGARVRRRATTRDTGHAVLALLVSITGLLAGCAGAPQVDAGLERDAAPTGTASQTELGRLPADEIAAMAKRDVAAVLDAQRPAEPPSPPAQSAASAAIRWNEPNRVVRANPPSDEEPGDTSAPTPPDVATGVLNRPDEVLDPVPPAPDAARNPTVAEALRTDRVGALLVDLSRELYRESSFADVPLRQLMAIAAQSIIDPNRALTPEAIPGLTERERELLGLYQTFCRQLGQRLREGEDAEQVFAEAVTQLETALVEAPILTIGEALLCFRVGGYGDFEAFEPVRFLAHAEQRVILYQEIEDFQSRLNDKGEWVTELSQQLVIFSDRDGIPVWTDVWQPTVDVSRRRRHDFFTVQLITLPKALGVGRYHLKVRVRDEQSTAEAEHTVTFEMVADPKMAAKVPVSSD